MTPERFKELRGWSRPRVGEDQNWVSECLDEIERLQGDNAQLREVLGRRWKGGAMTPERIDELREFAQFMLLEDLNECLDEIERLEAENARLHRLIEDIENYVLPYGGSPAEAMLGMRSLRSMITVFFDERKGTTNEATE